MESFFLRPGTDGVLAWVILVSIAVSGLCMLSLAAMLVVDRYRMRLTRKGSRTAGQIIF